MERAKPFSVETPTELARTLLAIAPLVESDRKPDHIPISDGQGSGGTLRQALGVVQVNCPKIDWIVKARVRWIEHGLNDWENHLGQLIVELDDGSKIDENELHWWSKSLEANTLSQEDFLQFITTGNVRGHRNRLLDRWFNIMARVNENLGGYAHCARILAKAIIKRHYCKIPHDPKRDEAACLLMLGKYFPGQARPLFEENAPQQLTFPPL